MSDTPIPVPYFMTNKEWYYFDAEKFLEENQGYFLTEEGKRNPEVVEDYKKYLQGHYSDVIKEDDNEANIKQAMGLNDEGDE